MSDITGTDNINNGNGVVDSNSSESTLSTIYPKLGDRPIGTTRSAKQLRSKIMLDSKFEAAQLYSELKKTTGKVPNGALLNICKSVEEKHGLLAGSIPQRTIRNRVDRNNLSGIQKQSISPLKDVENVIVQYCERLANMGAPLTKDQVISLANDLIKGTKYEESMVLFKEDRKIFVDPEDEKTKTVGVRWYMGLMQRHNDKLKRSKGLVRDIKRFNYCT